MECSEVYTARIRVRTSLQLRDCPGTSCGSMIDLFPPGIPKAGMLSIYDLRSNPVANSVSPFEGLHFYLPRSALDAIADMEGYVHIYALNPPPPLGAEDPVIYGLGRALLPAFERCDEVNSLFVDHITMASAVPCAAGSRCRRQIGDAASAGNLAPWLQRRVRTSLALSLTVMYPSLGWRRNAGLPISHFARAFEEDVGSDAVMEWLLRHQIDTAKALLV